MYTEEDFVAAIEAGVLSKETADAFRAYVAKSKCETPADEEPFRLLAGFNDIFVVIACLLLLVSVSWIGATAGGRGIPVAVMAWLLAEFFVRKRRMALPAVVLSLAFVGGIFFTGWDLAPKMVGSLYIDIVGSALAVLAAWLHWLRFHVPIIVAAGVAAALPGVILLLVAVIPGGMNLMAAILFAAGLLVFILALWWDATDTARRTWRSDVAFWLHLLAAPLLVHPLFSSFGAFAEQTTFGQAVAVIGLYVVIAFIALCVDRKALMVSALIYVLYAFSKLLEQHGVVSLNFAIAALVIGAALLLLSVFWRASRKHVLQRLPLAARARLAPLR